MEDQRAGAWGLVDVPYENASVGRIRYNSGFYSMMQFSKYIKKGYDMVHVNDVNSVAAYDRRTNTLVYIHLKKIKSAYMHLFCEIS